VTGSAPGKGRCVWQWGEHTLILLAAKALWDPRQRLLLVADLHLGKAELMQAHGIPFPSDGDHATLNALLALGQEFPPSEVVILGDLVHGRLGLTPLLRETVAALPEMLGCPVTWLTGNHDRGSWLEGLRRCGSHARGPLWLSHEPEPPGQRPAWARDLLGVCGHLHPVLPLRSRGDALRLPCFAFDPEARTLILPSFGTLTGGHPCRDRWRSWLVADGDIIPWQPLSHTPRR
jgi:DNA ligase-associated metallophosphoesterase